MRGTTFSDGTILAEDFVTTLLIFPIAIAADGSLREHDNAVKIEISFFAQDDEVFLD